MARLGLVVSALVATIGAVADGQVAVILAAGKAAVTNRGREAWYGAMDRGDVPRLSPLAGFPKIIDDPREDAPPASELLVLGACDPPMAARIVAALAPTMLRVTMLRLALPELRDSCPRLVTSARTSVAAMLSAKDPRGAAERARRRGEVPECALSPRELRRRFGTGYLCQSLWGVDCIRYAREAAATPPMAASCPFLLDTPEATSLLALRTGTMQLTACVADPDDDAAVAYVFARLGDSGIDYPAAAICGYGRGYGTRLGEVRPFGDGACIEYRRTYRNTGTVPQVAETGLHCYTQADAPPYAMFDRITISTRATANRDGRYAILGGDRDPVLCVEPGAGRRCAMGLGPRGFRSIAPLPPACATAAYRRIAP